MPATLAVTKGISILGEHGPAILNTTNKDVTAKVNLPRLQGPAQNRWPDPTLFQTCLNTSTPHIGALVLPRAA